MLCTRIKPHFADWGNAKFLKGNSTDDLCIFFCYVNRQGCYLDIHIDRQGYK